MIIIQKFVVFVYFIPLLENLLNIFRLVPWTKINKLFIAHQVVSPPFIFSDMVYVMVW